MGLAPSLEELDQALQDKQQKKQKRQSTEFGTVSPVKPKQEEKHSMTENRPSNENTASYDLCADGVVEYKVFGLGGAGKNLSLRHARNSKQDTPVVTIDTSGNDDSLDNVESIRISGLSGRGKLRRDETTLEMITNFISDYVSDNEFADINVVVHSLSGGSGSVIGPMMIDEILRQGKVAVVIGIIDQDSEVDTINALNSLRTLDNIAKSRDGYIPMVLFDNANGRHIVDQGVVSTLDKLNTLLSLPLIGLDKQDRYRFLQPQSFDGVTTGLKLLNISSNQDGNNWGDWEKNGQVHPDQESRERIDSMLIISHTEQHLTASQRCVVTFRGYFEQGDVLIGSLGYQIPDKVIKDLNATIHSHKSQAQTKETKIDSDKDYEVGKAHGKLIL